MALIDPPSYVSLSPALIYDADDLERETYKSLLQLAGWMWVTKRHQTPLRTTIAELAQRWNIKERATYARLQILAERGYIVATYGQAATGIHIALGPRALHRHTPGEPATHTQGEPGTHTPGEPAHNTPGEPATHTQGEPGTHTPGELAHTQGEPGPVRANSLHETGGSCKQLARSINNNIVVGVVSSDTPSEKLLLLQTITAAGVFPDVAARLVSDDWVTADRVRDWLAALEADARVKSLPAVLAANLRAHRPPPAAEDYDEQDWRRFTRHGYEDYCQ